MTILIYIKVHVLCTRTGSRNNGVVILGKVIIKIKGVFIFQAYVDTFNDGKISIFEQVIARNLSAKWKIGAIHNPRHVKPKTRQTPDTSNLRHIKPQTHQTSDKEYRAANYTTDKNTLSYFNWNSIWKLENKSVFHFILRKISSLSN